MAAWSSGNWTPLWTSAGLPAVRGALAVGSGVFVADDVHGGLLGRRAGAVDADVHPEQVRVPFAAAGAGGVRRDVGLADQAPGPGVADLGVVAELAVGVGQVAEAVVVGVAHAEVGELAGQPVVERLAGELLTGRGAPVVQLPRLLHRGEALVQR